MKTITKNQLIILFTIFIISLILSFQDFFNYSRNDYDFSWEVIFLYGWGNYSTGSVFFSLLIISGTLIPLISIIIFYLKNIHGKFPSFKDAIYYFQELNRVNKAARKIKEKQRMEKVRQEYKQKLAQLEEDKKKYL
jgi:hypothetical protein